MAGDALATRMQTEGNKLLDALIHRGYEFDFFQAVWLLERYDTEGLPIGDRGPVSGEAFRFRPHTSLGFPSCDIKRITYNPGVEDDLPFYRIDVTFMGLYGVSTPLPTHYAIDVLRSVDHHGTAADERESPSAPTPGKRVEADADSSPIRDFLDVFHHRLLSLFYRSWLKYRFDKMYGLRGHDVITDYLLWLIGCQPGYDEALLGLSPIRMLRYAGTLTLRPKSAVGLEGMLYDYWRNLPIQVEQCAGRWVSISPLDMNRIGLENSTLGTDLTIGEEIYDLGGAFNISIGPVDWEVYSTFLPDGERFAQTRALVEFYCSDPLLFSVEMKLQAGEVPDMCLSSDDQAGRLGFTSWVRTNELPATSVTFASTSGT